MKLYGPGGLGGKKPLSLPLRPASSPPSFAPQTRRSPQHTTSSRVPNPLHLSSDMSPLSLLTDQEQSYWTSQVAITISISSSLWLILTECPLCTPKVLYSQRSAQARRFLHSNTHFTDGKTDSEGYRNALGHCCPFLLSSCPSGISYSPPTGVLFVSPAAM